MYDEEDLATIRDAREEWEAGTLDADGENVIPHVVTAVKARDDGGDHGRVRG